MSSRPVGHHGEKPSETLARFIVEHSLGERVCCYDDRSGHSRPDAIIHRNGGVPLEIVSDPHKADVRLHSALAKIGNRARFDGLTHGYRVCLTTKARVKDLSWLETILQRLEDPQQSHTVPSHDDTYISIRLESQLAPGEVKFTSGSGGGRPIPKAADVVAAASAILAQKAYADVAKKLDAHGGTERHAVLIVDEENDSTFSWLREATPDGLDELPAPTLAPGITHLWITSRYTPRPTIHWSAADSWQGTAWDWGHPLDALKAWDDPACPDHHSPRPSHPRPNARRLGEAGG